MISEKPDLVKEKIELRKNEGFEAAARATKMGEGKRTMDDIRKVINEWEKEQDSLLKQQSVATQANAQNAKFIIVLGNLIVLIIVALAIFIINSDFTKRKQAEAKLKAKTDRGL